jgi:hypothetical protein
VVDPSVEEELAKQLNREVRIVNAENDGGQFEIHFQNQEDRIRFSNLLTSSVA